jgi:sec-independent protein translocase protein TatB
VLGINGGEFLLLIVVALVVVGPERLPRYAEQLGAWVRTARSYAMSAKSRVTEELGEDVADVDWAALDPRRYDPRRIVREALLDDSPATPSTRPRPSPSGAGSSAVGSAAAGAARAAAEPYGVPSASGPGPSSARAARAAAQRSGAAAVRSPGAAGGSHASATDGAGPATDRPSEPAGAGAAPVDATPFDDEAT